MGIFKDFFELIRKVVDGRAGGVTINLHDDNLSRRTGKLYGPTFDICSNKKTKQKIISQFG
jgi:hypothetical protein